MQIFYFFIFPFCWVVSLDFFDFYVLPVQLLVFVNKCLIKNIALINGCVLLLTTILCTIILVWLGSHIIVPGSPLIIRTTCWPIQPCRSLCCWLSRWWWLASRWSRWLRSWRSGWSGCCNRLSSWCWCWWICWRMCCLCLISSLIDSEDLHQIKIW